MSLMSVRHPLAVEAELISPDVWPACDSATRGELPFRLGRQSLARPVGIGHSVWVSDLDNRVIALDVAARTRRMPPVRTGYVGPPLVVIVQRYGVVGRRENY